MSTAYPRTDLDAEADRQLRREMVEVHWLLREKAEEIGAAFDAGADQVELTDGRGRVRGVIPRRLSWLLLLQS